jgi:4'-phosphopantetheinyl transferase
MRPPAANECHVWWAATGEADPRQVALLDPVERRRREALWRPGDRARFTLGCAMLRTALAGYLGRPPSRIRIDRTCPRCGRPHGKTRLRGHDGSGLELSVAHSADRVAIAVARGVPVGVDVERVRDDLDVDGLAPVVLSAADSVWLAGFPPSERVKRFLELWTRKEAVLKARGTGITGPLSAVTGAGFSLHELPVGSGYVASLAVNGRCDTVLTREARALWRPAGEPAAEPLTA